MADAILQACAILGWLGLVVGFLGRTSETSRLAPQRDWRSLAGLGVQGLGMALAWGWRRPAGAAFFSNQPALDWLLVPIALALVGGADWLVFRAVRGLGRQWSLEARVLDDHQLVMTGAYGIVRHPIYTGIYGLLIATGFAFATWPALLAAAVIYWIGTKLRTVSEEGLLRAHFGAAYDIYAARVPAVVPVFRRAPVGPLLFSYGTLQRDDVQLSTYGRRLKGWQDELVGFTASTVAIADAAMVAKLGTSHHNNLLFNQRDDSRVAGTVFEVTDAELIATDGYEAPFFYKRRTATLASGPTAWVYVHACAVRRAVAGDEPLLRAIRLDALQESPEAFGSTYERELARTDADWQRWLSPGATFVLEGSEGPRGIVACRHHVVETGVTELLSMWVHPASRGSGDGDALVAAVVSWARAEGDRVVRLNVVQGNLRARRFYERQGFRPTGTEMTREPAGPIEVEMDRLIE